MYGAPQRVSQPRVRLLIAIGNPPLLSRRSRDSQGGFSPASHRACDFRRTRRTINTDYLLRVCEVKSDYLSTSKPTVKSSSQGSKASTVTNNNQNSNSNSNKNNSDEQSSCDATPTGNCDAGACDIAPSRLGHVCSADANTKTHLNDPNGDYTNNNDYSDLVGLN